MGKARSRQKKKARRGDPSLVGTTIQGRYHLVRLLGDGGMGAVYKAADQVLRRFVAIKLLHPSTSENPAAVERFVREARSAAAIGHPNIIDILDFGHEGNRPFLVMEYLRGRSLSEAIAEEIRFSVRRSCSIATHALAGLAAAHDRGILHRDLKPANLMLIAQLGDRDFVKLCDFGFAALVVPTVRIDGGKSLTPARTLVGTPAYAAPERLRGDDRRDPRIDVYSIGVVLYEMLAGRRPFDAPTFRELARKVRNEPPPSLKAIRSDVPKGLDRVVRRALAKKREERWANAEEFASALVPFGGRVIPRLDDLPSDSFTMDLLRIRARETQQQRSMSPSEAEEILAMREAYKREREARRAEDESESLSIDIDLPSQSPESLQSTDAALRKPEARRNDTERPGTSPDTTQPGHVPGFEDLHFETQRDVRDGKTDRPVAMEDPTTVIDPRTVLGRLSLSVLKFVARRFGERALNDLLRNLPPMSRVVFDAGVTETTWVPYDAHNLLVQTVDARLGRDDLHLVVQCGRAAAEGAFDLMRELRPPSPPPELLLAEMPKVLSKLMHGVEVRVDRVGRGYGRMELDEHGESSLTACVFLIGFLDRSLDRFGASDVEVNLISSPALGDEECVYEISWIS